MSTETMKAILTIVTCAFSTVEEPFHQSYARETVVGTVLAASAVHFKAAPEPGFELYLTHDGERLEDDATLESVVGEGHELKCRLVKELIQG